MEKKESADAGRYRYTCNRTERDGKSEDVAAVAEIAPTDFVSLKKSCLCRRESGKLESITATEKGIAMCVLSISNKNLVHFRALENSVKAKWGFCHRSYGRNYPRSRRKSAESRARDGGILSIRTTCALTNAHGMLLRIISSPSICT